MPKRGATSASASKRSKQQRKYNSKPAQKKNRAARNQARVVMKRSGKVGPNQDVNHKKKLKDGGSNAKSNLSVRSKSSNRADNGKTGGRKPKRKPTKRK